MRGRRTFGVLLSFLATGWLAGHWNELPRADAIHLDGTVLAFAVRPGVSYGFDGRVVAGYLLHRRGHHGLQESSRSIGGSLSRAMLRKTLLTVEIALTVVLLVSAGLLFKSFLHLRTANLGCATDHVLTMSYGLPDKQYDTRAKVIAFHQSLLERVRRLPGVIAAGLVSTPAGRRLRRRLRLYLS